ncbi:MAG: sensor histidine kinase [Anaerolineales bacterium]
MWAAISFIWYGILGQIFVHESSLALSQVVNQELFQRVFQFPVQLLRAAAALAISIFVTRFLRSFEVERQNQLDMLQESRLKEAQRRETMRGELLRKVVDAQEAERKRIARELHDATGQALTALGMGIRGISSKLPEEAGEEIENLKNLESLAVKSLDELRIFISDLRPSHLDELGLRSALRWYVGDILQRVDFDISLEVPHESANLPPSISTALFRVAQEAVTNIIKHAQAKNVWIRLGYRKNGDVRLEVEDDGIGFNPNQIQMMSGPTWGLMGMQERTILCGGEFSLLTAPGEGTLVQVTIPGTEIKKVKDKNENQNLSG